MTHPNEQLLRDFFAAQARGDADAVLAALTDDVTWHVPGRNLLSRDYRGKAEVSGFWNHVRELSNGTVRPQVLEVMSGEKYAIALVKVYAEREGKTLDGSFQAWAYRIEDSRIAEFWFLVEDRYAVDDFWS